MEDVEESPVEDRRLDFICDYVLRTLKLKRDRWQKLISGEDNRRLLQDFLDRSDNKTLVMSVTTAGLLRPSASFTASRNKAVYFMKRSEATLSADTMMENLVCGDLCSAPLHQLSVVVQEVSSRMQPGSYYSADCRGGGGGPPSGKKYPKVKVGQTA